MPSSQEAYGGLLGTEGVNRRHGSSKDGTYLRKNFEFIYIHIITACNIITGCLEALLCSRGDGECTS